MWNLHVASLLDALCLAAIEYKFIINFWF